MFPLFSYFLSELKTVLQSAVTLTLFSTFYPFYINILDQSLSQTCHLSSVSAPSHVVRPHLSLNSPILIFPHPVFTVFELNLTAELQTPVCRENDPHLSTSLFPRSDMNPLFWAKVPRVVLIGRQAFFLSK